jgi:hypothetical protein
MSSKGFDFRLENEGKSNERKISVVSDYLDVIGRNLNESLLVSAYDIFFGHLADAQRFQADFLGSVWANPKALFIDSGGYESSTASYDLSHTYRFAYTPEEWSEEKYVKTLKSFSGEVSGILINFDFRVAYEEQIALAQRFFAGWSRFFSDFLLKPEGDNKPYIEVERIYPLLPRLSAFNILGVAEKELGNTILDRLKTIAKLRRLLDERGVDVPIHVFGSLDTLYTPLYFLAGAEIFDGLTWLRYAYHEGHTLYAEALALLQGDVELRWDQRGARVHVNNLDYLQRLSRSMKRYLSSGDLSVFGPIAPTLSATYSALMSELGEKA